MDTAHLDQREKAIQDKQKKLDSKLRVIRSKKKTLNRKERNHRLILVGAITEKMLNVEGPENVENILKTFLL